MTRDFDDDAIAQLVRDTAAGWTMPPVRLDAPAWRERVQGPRQRRVATVRGWFGRLGQAATAAVALTVVGALVAVLITRPLSPASSPAASDGATPGHTAGPSAGAEATGLPRLILEGDGPTPAKVVVETETGDFELVDLEKGSIGPALTGARRGSALHVMADGSMVCLCLAESLVVAESPTVASVTLERFTAAGAPTSSTPIETFTGEPDPRDVGTFVPERPPHVLTSVSFSDDGRYGYVGWSERAHPVWNSGIVVVDLVDGSVVDRLVLPDAGTGDGQTRRVIVAPHIVGAGPNGLLIARSWFSWAPVTSSNASYRFDNEVSSASFSDGRFAAPTELPNVEGCGETVISGGAIAGGGAWVACSSGGSASTVVRRISADGLLLGDARVLGPGGIDGDLTARSTDSGHLFIWNPVSAMVTRVDLATGETATGQGSIPVATTRSPLSALGEWLAPIAAAKSFLRGGIVLSPDGSRVYALGVRSAATGPEAGGSTGVFAFDAATLANVGQYPPAADFASLAVSRDGRFVYAAGLPGVDAAGATNRRFSASITVFDATDGSVRLIAGQLGGEALSFLGPVLD